jgi:hypothetical protein
LGFKDDFILFFEFVFLIEIICVLSYLHYKDFLKYFLCENKLKNKILGKKTLADFLTTLL